MIRLGLPGGIAACLFDLDGVLTQTAKVHFAAWKQMFDAFLQGQRGASGQPQEPFSQADYDQFVDGKPRFDGVRSFVASRGIELPEGTMADPPEIPTVGGLGNRKNQIVLALIRTAGVEPYAGSVRYLDAALAAGLARAVVSSSANCRDVLAAAGIGRYFDVVVDGIVAEQEHIVGKPAPDMFLAAAAKLDVDPAAAAVFEDALAGVAAGRAGGFGYVVGVNRVGQAEALRQQGADVVVDDLADLLDPGVPA